MTCSSAPSSQRVEEGADHLLLAGDLVDHAWRPHLEALRELLRTHGWWEPARLTVLPGNHDLYGHTYEHFFRAVVRGLPGFDQATAAFRDVFGEVMGDPIADAALPSLKRLGAGWLLLCLDTVVRTHRLDFMGSWRGWLDDALSERTRATLAAAAPERVVVASHHFPMARSPARTHRTRGMAFDDRDFERLVRLLEGLTPAPRLYLCGHVHYWGKGDPGSFDGEVVAGVPVYCQGRTGGVDGVEPSWTLHALADDGAVTSRLFPL